MNRTILASCVVAAVFLLSGGERQAFAQYNGMNSRSMGYATKNYLYNRPTVSPYLNLTSRNSSYGMPRYFTQVRPQIEARDHAMQTQRQTSQMQQQLNIVQDQLRQNQQQSAGMMMTGRMGWSSRGYPRFGSYMSYFPGFQRVPRR